MNLISLIIVVTILCLVLYIVNQVVPMPAWLKTVVNCIVGLVVVVWLLRFVGLGSFRL